MEKKIKKIRGTVEKISTNNTIKVEVENTLVSKLYGKRYKSHKSYLTDMNGKKVKVGDIVEIIMTRPISKRKKHQLFNIIKKA